MGRREKITLAALRAGCAFARGGASRCGFSVLSLASEQGSQSKWLGHGDLAVFCGRHWLVFCSLVWCRRFAVCGRCGWLHVIGWQRLVDSGLSLSGSFGKFWKVAGVELCETAPGSIHACLD